MPPRVRNDPALSRSNVGPSKPETEIMRKIQPSTFHREVASEPVSNRSCSRDPDVGGSNAKQALSIAEFCRAYSIGRTLVFDLIRSGALKARKAGTRTIILADDAETWSQALPSATEPRKPVNGGNNG